VLTDWPTFTVPKSTLLGVGLIEPVFAPLAPFTTYDAPHPERAKQQKSSARKLFARLVSPNMGACQCPRPDFVRGKWLEGRR
jgi:hypothetical protein